MEEKYEIRSFGGDAAPKVSEDRKIWGYAAVFGQESRVMIDVIKKRFFIEIIEPGAITEETLRKCDVKALIDHNRQRMLARCVNGSGTLTLNVDSMGMGYNLIAPNTNDGNYAVEMIKRGDIFGSSFAFWTDEKKNVSYEKRNDGIVLRRVHKIDRVFDVCPVADPAYMGTNVNARSIDAYFEPEKQDESYKNDINLLRNLINI